MIGQNPIVPSLIGDMLTSFGLSLSIRGIYHRFLPNNQYFS
jgi:hypothetical protein